MLIGNYQCRMHFEFAIRQFKVNFYNITLVYFYYKYLAIALFFLFTMDFFMVSCSCKADINAFRLPWDETFFTKSIDESTAVSCFALAGESISTRMVCILYVLTKIVFYSEAYIFNLAAEAF